jgi:hypothetical protein
MIGIGEYKLYAGDQSVRVSWGDKLQLTGRYMFSLSATSTEVLRLFKLMFGDKFSRERINSLGITVEGVQPTQEELSNAVFKIRRNNIHI